jgi:hypothetical protein
MSQLYSSVLFFDFRASLVCPVTTQTAFHPNFTGFGLLKYLLAINTIFIGQLTV